MSNQEAILGAAASLCPVCLKRIPARNVAAGDDVYQEKTCPEHGRFRTIIWRGPPSYLSWGAAAQPPAGDAATDNDCPFDCGLCPGHRRQTCCVLLEVTQRCNLGCPVCFAGAGGKAVDPDLATVESWYRRLLVHGGPYNIQLSGGEPTLRDDLPEMIALGKSLGYSFFQLNTNGLRLAEDQPYGLRLKQAGLSCVFLQFDGLDDTVYEKIRGKALLAIKKAAIARCAELGLGVVLVPTLVPGINTAQIGRLVDFAVSLMPAVRGVHFQPVSYFGRYPQPPADADRFTLPELMRAIEAQTGGKMKTGDFRPSGARNAYCAFHANYLVAADGGLKLLNNGDGKGCCQSVPAADGVRKARSFVARRWSAAGSARTDSPACCPGVDTGSLDAFLDTVDQRSLCISAMAFQDSGTIDTARLKDCPLHVLHPDGRLIPFCAYNLTDMRGEPLYRPRSVTP
ncbi:radical SAM (seleno)protein TrsS [Anaeroselena agilis]|uniref:Radical SAM protein n=1 Tax=Anaeroselena agilis TaxID=3063788 RepID=A0ABU3NV57_9FIRM|nr:radical SAM protein [Selenomonadales bacterium 4137-cl]